MSLRFLGPALAVPLIFAATAPAMADEAKATAKSTTTTAPGEPGLTAPKGWKVPRTEWGDPNLTGRWPIDNLSSTPSQRPPNLGTKAWLTDEEYAAATKAADDQLKLYNMEVKANRMGMGHWTERGTPTRQTSLIMEPADGRIPPPTPLGKELSKNTKSSWTEQTFEWVTDFSPMDRCITRGLPGSMMPGAYNSGIEVWQSPGYAVIRTEEIHEARIIPIARGKGPPPAPVKGWMGYSVGHWEGDTLVIETTNFIPGQPIGGNGGIGGRPIPNSDQMKVVERLTPTGPDHIHYEAWVSDPVTLTAPFKYDFPWTRNSNYKQYEYACFEGNEQTRGYIEGTSPFEVAKREAREKARTAGTLAATDHDTSSSSK
jgi:hypothetical protein